MALGVTPGHPAGTGEGLQLEGVGSNLFDTSTSPAQSNRNVEKGSENLGGLQGEGRGGVTSVNPSPGYLTAPPKAFVIKAWNKQTCD